ncbi:CPBP family intramembrane glutamic endopeptidase [Sporosarcina limicola]|uniref:Membrane protease YdiL (CAAX protease family) n=1 Tax=Sporosarcina limicola TaxID=34101 RepID=A0A927MG68_9BACL|nr:type II CAAX endopeptidase family protein [Sporosarcina limicola]MBE1553176.1 membrane protease YdiL (CAAX protease family) [Sporosarcina limicola]
MSNEKTNIFAKRPILSVILIEVCFLLAVFIAGAIATIKQLDYTSPVLISFIPTAVVLILYFTLKRKWRSFGFKIGQAWRNWLLYLPLLLILIILCFQGFNYTAPETILFYLGFSILVGFVEESIYRGLIVHILVPKGIVTAIITSSLLFSLSHILNSLSGQSIEQTLLQVAYALLLGIVLAQLMIKNGSIYPLILFHTLHNFIQFIGKGGYNPILDATILIILVITIVVLSMPSRKIVKTNSGQLTV